MNQTELTKIGAFCTSNTLAFAAKSSEIILSNVCQCQVNSYHLLDTVAEKCAGDRLARIHKAKQNQERRRCGFMTAILLYRRLCGYMELALCCRSVYSRMRQCLAWFLNLEAYSIQLQTVCEHKMTITLCEVWDVMFQVKSCYTLQQSYSIASHNKVSIITCRTADL